MTPVRTPRTPRTPNHRRAARATLTAGAVTSALVLPIMIAVNATASPGPTAPAAQQTTATQPLPTAAARAAGIARPGDAYMGWSDKHLTMTAKVEDGKLTLAKAATSPLYGIDVSHWQGTVNWNAYYASGKRFAYVKATEGSTYTSNTFSAQYSGSYKAGFIRGAYHYGLPNGAGGAIQADYFVNHGGGWSRDGKTLPGVLDIEYNPYGSSCYGKSRAQLVTWVKSFVTEYKHRTGRDAVIYTAYNFWVPCMGNSTSFSTTNPLWLANYQTRDPALPGGWPYLTFQQYTNSPIDSNLFNGTYSRLQALALG